ncbi:ArsR family transcriptional regulator [candidate division WS5 bacterium]|uniref:ArsR family transcriptional regulator n=1 Tax=candidate division WS5 bacterium TaxID=2093353 RepID=A0A419DFP8_9BACT|nr:MAG: ArsR family transcriptional regulator [candidate division WS5 bacterium]
MYEKLFGSKTRAKLLSLFLNNADKSYYVREITRTINEQINSVRRELANLKSLDIVVSQSKKGKLYYKANKKSDLYSELKKIFAKPQKEAKKTKEADLTKRVKGLGDVSYAALMGHFVKDNSSPIDFFIVGKVNRRRLKTFIAQMEKETKKEINYSLMDLDEFENRKLMFDRFMTEVMASPKDVIVDYIDEKGEAEGFKSSVQEEKVE